MTDNPTGPSADAQTPFPASGAADAQAGAPSGQASRTIVIPAGTSMVALLGPNDQLLTVVERALPRLEVYVRGNEIRLEGSPADVDLGEQLFDELILVAAAGQRIDRDAVERSIRMLASRTRERPAEVLTQNILSSRGRSIRPKTLGQKRYVDAIDRHTIVFGIGPAGTGKTYLAMAKAVAALQAKEVNRIILTRPAVEAGERLGFLPGTLTDKIDPYLRPLYDALHDMVDPDSIPRLMATGTVEVAPLAYMRGRAQPLDSRVLTPEGFREFGSLQVGDLVVGSDGTPTPVLGVYPQGRKPVYRVTATDGASTLCCGEHLWTVAPVGGADDAKSGRWVTLETAELIGREQRYELPVVHAVAFPDAPVPTDPYALGLALGEGRPAAMAAASATPRGDMPTATSASEVTTTLGTKAAPPVGLPESYLHNSVEVRSAVLRGLLVGSGATGSDPHGPIGFGTSSARLRDDVLFLVRSLGGLASSRPHPDGDGFVVDLRLPNDGAAPVRHIESIEPAGEAETMCIQVAAADSLYVTDDFLVTHNTLNDAFIILDEAQNTSPEQMKMFLTRLGFGSTIVVTGDVTQVDLPGGTQSGLRVVQDILGGVDDIHFSYLTSDDVVRHRLVGDIVDAYGRWDEARHRRPDAPGGRHPRPARRAHENGERDET